ncbi:hypothetical protein PV410_12930 [Streptomyces sp. PA03-5A]|nr:hypothetical protein [Streptomyces sp. PA03-5A]
MDMQGVGAIAAAAVAAATVPITLLVGRWQVRAAIRAGQDTYRAAVDAAQQQGTAAHSQWRREVRREAYASLLLAGQGVIELGGHFLGGKWIPDPTVEITSERELLMQMHPVIHAINIVQLEGPDSAAEAAKRYGTALEAFTDAAAQRSHYERAVRFMHEKLQIEADANTQDGPALKSFIQLTDLRGAIREATPEQRSDWVRPAPDNPLREPLEELRLTMRELGDEGSIHWSRLVISVTNEPDFLDVLNEGDVAYKEFLRVARLVLD